MDEEQDSDSEGQVNGKLDVFTATEGAMSFGVSDRGLNMDAGLNIEADGIWAEEIMGRPSDRTGPTHAKRQVGRLPHALVLSTPAVGGPQSMHVDIQSLSPMFSPPSPRFRHTAAAHDDPSGNGPKKNGDSSSESEEVALDTLMEGLSKNNLDSTVTREDCRSLRRLLKQTIDYLQTLVASTNPQAGHTDDITQNERRAEVRNHALELMHRDSNADPIPVVSAERADHYARTKRREDGPTSDVFALDFMDNLGSHWNMRAKAVFAESFIQSGYSCKDKREVQRVFTVHVGTLRRQFKVLMRDPDYEPTPEELEQEKARNRAARRRELRKRRRDGCKRLTNLRHLVGLWESIPYLAMSGDESEEGPHGRRFLITALPWRSKEFEQFLADMDFAQLSTRWTAAGSWSKGNMPHVREGRNRQHMRPDDRCQAVERLPRNFYDEDWLRSMQENDSEEVSRLDIQQPVDLTIPDNVAR
ncbi:hypothetical protein FOMPIDRAFT_1056403 [Fomitopsis schrenkii]|uniref:Uncharacterized protein n=1 Tax=Fomitopsis schrenkii TaxID=2126942 RepID=S8ETA9_FOMSC|nr:hypothetical protein FOMPIDRAFT_1056403 [Fomitopsis schrenkii]